MLCISRRRGQRVRIRVPGGPDIWIKVTLLARGLVSLGIDAPREVLISREEQLTQETPEGQAVPDAT